MPRNKNNTPSLNVKWKRTVIWMIALIILGVFLTILLSPNSGLLKTVPMGFKDIFRLIIVLVIGALVTTFFERHIFRFSVDRLGSQSATSIRYAARLMIYIIIALSALGAVGVGLSSVVFGGAFLTVIIGLAGQTMFSNLIAGIWIIVFHPFQVGEFITFITWQYPVLMPSFPHESLKPMYTGYVKDINLMYTLIETQEGYPQVIPNGILVQAAIENRSSTVMHTARIRFDVSYDVEAAVLIDRLRERLQPSLAHSWVVTPQVMVADLYPTSYSILIKVQTDERDDDVRSAVLMEAAKVLASLKIHSLS